MKKNCPTDNSEKINVNSVMVRPLFGVMQEQGILKNFLAIASSGSPSSGTGS